MAFEGLNSETGEIIKVSSFKYGIFFQKLSKKDGQPIYDAGGNLVYETDLIEKSQDEYDEVKKFLICPECKKNGWIVAPSVTNAGTKCPAHFRFRHLDDCTLKNEGYETNVTSQSPVGRPPSDKQKELYSDRLIKFVLYMFNILHIGGVSHETYSNSIQTWELRNRENEKKEVTIRNEDMRLPLLSLLKVKLEDLRTLTNKMPTTNEREEKNYGWNMDMIANGEELLKSFTIKPKDFNDHHDLYQSYGVIKTKLPGKIPWAVDVDRYNKEDNASFDIKQLIEHQEKMEKEFMLIFEKDSFFFRQKNSYEPCKITKFKELHTILSKYRNVIKTIKEFTNTPDDDKKGIELFTDFFKKIIPKIDEDYHHLKPCMEILMMCESLNIDCCNIIKEIFDYILSHDNPKQLFEYTKNPRRYRTQTLWKINNQIKFSLFEEKCNDPDLYLPEDETT